MLLSWILFLTPDAFILFGAACLLLLFGGLPLLLRQSEARTALLPAEGEVLDFEEHLVQQSGAATVVTRLLVRFHTATGHTVVGPAVRGGSLLRLRYRRGQRVAVRYDPANPGQFAVPAVEAARRNYAVVMFCLFGAGLLGLSVLCFILSAVLRAA